jgi:hypothetical protein
MTVKAQPTQAVNPGCKESAGVANKETIENTKRHLTDSRVVESGDFSFQFSANSLSIFHIVQEPCIITAESSVLGVVQFSDCIMISRGR